MPIVDPNFTLSGAPGGVDWEVLEDAIFEWVQSSTQLAPDQICWTNQGQNRRVGALCSITVTGLTPVGIESRTHLFETGQPQGEEILHTVTGDRILTVRVQHFGGDATGMLASYAALARAMTALRLPSQTSKFSAAGLGVLSADSIANISGPLALQIEPRAQLTVRFSMKDALSERGGYIATAPLTVTVHPTP